MINPSHINYLLHKTTTIILALEIADEIGLQINIGLVRIQIQYGENTDESIQNIVLTQKIMLFIIVNRENLTKGWAKRHCSTVTLTVHKSKTPLNPQIFKNTSSCHPSFSNYCTTQLQYKNTNKIITHALKRCFENTVMPQ